MSKGRKSSYPMRPERRSSPKSSHSGGRKSKTWSSDVSKVEGGCDISPRLNFPWWKAPMYRDARLAKWG